MTFTITRKELYKKLRRGEPVVLVDVLPTIDYSYAHLPGAINIPYTRIDDLAPSMLPDKRATIVVYYANSFYRESTTVAAHLERLGYSNVSAYREGKQDWMMAGMPMESCILRARHSLSAEASPRQSRPPLFD